MLELEVWFLGPGIITRIKNSSQKKLNKNQSPNKNHDRKANKNNDISNV